jgi:uncharacterized protein YjaZ
MKILNFIENKSLWQNEELFKPFRFLRHYMPDADVNLKDSQAIQNFFQLDTHASLSPNQLRLLVSEVQRGYKFISKIFPKVEKPIYLFTHKDKTEGASALNGIIGYAMVDGLLIAVDPEASWEEDIFETVIHEMNHVVRYPFGNPHENFLNWLLLEGMAEQFTQELFPSKAPNRWVTSVPKEELKGWFQRVEPFLDKMPPDAYEWFFGSIEKQIPSWLGYSLGFEMVRIFRANSSVSDWSEFIKTPSEDILKLYRKQLS